MSANRIHYIKIEINVLNKIQYVGRFFFNLMYNFDAKPVIFTIHNKFKQ